MVGLGLKPPEDICLGVKRVASAQLSEAVALLDAVTAGQARSGVDGEFELAIHRIRKRSKEVRGILELTRPGLGRRYRPIVTLVRDGAGELGGLRDAQVQLATLDRVIVSGGMANSHKAAKLRARQARKVEDALDALSGPNGPLGSARARFVEADELVRAWRIAPDFDPVLDGVADTYRRGARRHSQVSADPCDDAIHQWRKAVKQLWYQVRVLEAAAPSVLTPLAANLDILGELLGGDHDMAMLMSSLRREDRKNRPKAALRTARSQQTAMRDDAIRLGATLYAERPRAFARRLRVYWDLSSRIGSEPNHAGRLLSGGTTARSDPSVP